MIASLHGNIQALAQADYQRDGMLTRGDVIGILNEAAQEGRRHVTAMELKDLNRLSSASNDLGITVDIENLFSKVIGYNPANKHFQGHVLLSNGRLTAGNSGAKLTDLVDKWFLGEDLPSAGRIGYAAANGNLFGPGGPSNLDVMQGEVGDCYFLAALAETAARAPLSITNMFTDNGDGTFTIRFFRQVGGSQIADYVTVNRELPAAGGQFVFANLGQSISSTSNVLWVALAEKAYAQLAEEGWSRAGLARPVNSYNSINGGMGNVALQQIMGEATSAVWTLNSTTMNGLIDDLAAGDLITLASRTSEPRNSNVIANHEYYVTGYDANAKTFTVVNPWGANLPRIGTLELTAAQIEKYYTEYDVAAG